MKILDRYIFTQFVRTFLFASAAFVALFILINMVENLDEFMDSQIPGTDIARYYLFSIPETLLLTSPVSALLSSILVAGRLALSSELPAIRSAGVSMRQLLHPFFLGGLLISAVNIVNSFWIAPSAKGINNTFERQALGKSGSDDEELRRNLHILEPGNRVVTIGQLAPALDSGNAISIEQFDGAGLSWRIDGRSIRLDPAKGTWLLDEAVERRFADEGEEYRREPSREVELQLSLKSLAEMNLRPDEMNVVQHLGFLAEKRKAGFAGLERSSVKLHAKLAVPFASLVIILIGVPLSAKKKRGGLAAEIGITLFAGFLFLGLQKTIATMGYNGILPPLMAAWLPNLLFLGVGYAIYRNAPD